MTPMIIACPDSDCPVGSKSARQSTSHFDGGVEEFVDQDRGVGDGRGLDGVGHVIVELIFIGDDFHRAAAEDEAGTDEDGIADAIGDFPRLGDGSGDAVDGLFQAEFLQQVAELLAIAGGVEGFDGGAEDRDAGFFQAAGEVERGLSAELDDDAFDKAAGFVEGSAIEPFADVQNIFMRQRLEKKQIAGVVIGADGFGIGIDHDRFQSEFLHRECGLNAAVIEFDSLADAIWTAADDDDFGFVGEADFVFARKLKIAKFARVGIS